MLHIKDVFIRLADMKRSLAKVHNFVCLFEWMPYQRKESVYPIIMDFASSGWH